MTEKTESDEEFKLPHSLTVVPDITDEATYNRIVAEIQKDMRDDQRNAERRALNQLAGYLNPANWFRQK